MQLLLYAPATSPRLAYICHFIFKDMMSLDFAITTNRSEFSSFTGIKINYGNELEATGHFTIGNIGLLFKHNIEGQDIRCFEVNNYTAFFPTENADLPFDILSATFYLLSRYEEYLPHTKDKYGRYAHENSLAFRNNFLHLPLINTWVIDLIKILQEKFSTIVIHPPSFSFIPTYDIDIAFSYKYKGWLRNVGGFLKSPSLNRIKVLLGLTKDPFDSYKWMNGMHQLYNLQPIYFFLMAKKNGVYDKNILPQKTGLRSLVLQHAKEYPIGIHPSWQSGDQPALVQYEKDQLQTISGITITRSRQHYIRFNLPAGYRLLIKNGITDDYSMGYGSINGFRASAASPFYWYDLEKEESTMLRIHPFCFMDANSFYHQKLTAAEAYNELKAFYSICKAAGAEMITIWHNNFLGTHLDFSGWRDVYERFMIHLNNGGPK